MRLMKFIVGLGNPGEAYARSRHNVGFLVVDQFARDQEFPAARRKLAVRYREKRLSGAPVFLLQPETFMNRSGPAVRDLVAYFGGDVPPAEGDLLVVHDDLDLPRGRLRFRAQGSSGGHRGVESVIQALATDRFHRLKIGIGRPEHAGRDAADYVLERLGGDEETLLLEVASRAAKMLGVWIDEGIVACANRFNGMDFSTR
ncbi:MAG: aminoacyl-tRNA hydrolase [Planctomycetes bacterium]|nr:aminoacyl-tRNA hydrolase [Planctomycetota bacterium]